MEEIKNGDIVIVTDHNYIQYCGKEMYCIGISPDGFIQLSFNKKAVIADVYLGNNQCKKKC